MDIEPFPMTGIESTAQFDPAEGLKRYKVIVGSLAEFVVRAYGEDQAKQKTEYWCGENPFMEIDSVEIPARLFDDWYVAKPLEPIEEQYHDALGNTSPSVKLVRDYRGIEIPGKAAELPKLVSLFDVNNSSGTNRSKPRRIT